MAREGIELARRRSGGGTVYHDRGNLCYSFINTVKSHDKNANSELIADALKSGFGINAEVNERNDILVDRKKVSGAAYRLTGGRAYHHGTLLVDSSLERLKRSILSPELRKISTKATDSVRSKVMNLREVVKGLTVDKVSHELERTVRTKLGISEPVITIRSADMTEEDIEEIEKLKQKSWLFGETPKFKVSYEMDFSWGEVQVDMEIERGGKVTYCSFAGPNAVYPLPLLGKTMAGVTFGGAQVSKEILHVARALSGDQSFLEDIARYLEDKIATPFSAPSSHRRDTSKDVDLWQIDPIMI
mmetsp:Transcript_11012/g.45855  ORF Transcript_11012/g.45855 Transcript_11012/m.45855 type:complete len:302 (+) Transcript_11012:4012-4917(+)